MRDFVVKELDGRDWDVAFKEGNSFTKAIILEIKRISYPDRIYFLFYTIPS